MQPDNLARLPVALQGLDSVEEELYQREKAAAAPAVYSYELIPDQVWD